MIGDVYAANIIASKRLGIDVGMEKQARALFYMNGLDSKIKPSLFIHVSQVAARGVYALTGSYDDVVKLMEAKYNANT